MQNQVTFSFSNGFYFLFCQVKFFDGLTPQMVLNDQDAYNRLLDFLHLMCPSKRVLSQRPMMECCIKSYSNPESSSICYQLFDTILVKWGKKNDFLYVAERIVFFFTIDFLKFYLKKNFILIKYLTKRSMSTQIFTL